MEIKNILSKLNQSTEPPKKFFAVEIGYEVVKTAVWHVENKATQIIAFGSIEEWSTTPESLLQAVDKSLNIASQDIDQEPNEVIFGFPESWIGQEGLLEEKKAFVKLIKDKLELKPVGFVVTIEAIVHHLRLKEGSPPSTILASLTETEAVISLVKQGQIVDTHSVGRSDDLCKDVQEGLARFGTAGDFPSRIVIFDGNIDLESAKQTLINYDWQDTVNFLHFPKIEDLDSHATITAIAIAGGAEVAKSQGIQIQTHATPDKPTLNQTDDEEVPAVDPVPASLPPQPPKPHENTVDESTSANPADFGFTEVSPTTKGAEKPDFPSSGDNFATQADTHPNAFTVAQDTAEPDSAFSESVETPPVKTKKSFAFPKLPKIRFPRGLKIPALLPIGLLLLILAAAGTFAAYWFLPKAHVTIYTRPTTIDKEISFVLDPNQPVVDIQAKSIPTASESIELDGEKEIPTTGTKTVGERAKGKVAIYNLTQSSRTFEAGTRLTIDNFVFTTNEAITIASATAEISADYKTIVTPSQESVSAMAIDIGDRYNFGKDTELTVANFAKTSFVARVTTDFTGGFAREIQAVSKTDQDNLRKALTQELKTQAIANLSVIASQKKGVVEIGEDKVLSETFSADIGEERELIRLALRFQMPLYSYQLDDLAELIASAYSQDFPANAQIASDNLQVTPTSATPQDDGTILVEAKAKIAFVPQIDTAQVVQKIRGIHPKNTEDYFKSLPNFSRVSTEFSTKLPPGIEVFPRVLENITVTVEIEQP